MASGEVVVLWCGECGLPWARLQNGVVVVQSKHHGEKHVNGVAVDELVKMCQERSAPVAEYDFSGLSDLDLVEMQKQVRESGEDEEFLEAVLVELGKRHRRLLGMTEEDSES